jgi:hypothetical protein
VGNVLTNFHGSPSFDKKKDNYWEWRLTHENDTMVLSVGVKQGIVYVVRVHQK